MSVNENRREDATFRGWGQELYFNDGGHRSAFMAERRSDVVARDRGARRAALSR
jgi:hypothetical protein